MTDFSVLKSFAIATIVSSVNDNNEDDKAGSGSSDFFSPSHENTILAPYNFSFT